MFKIIAEKLKKIGKKLKSKKGQGLVEYGLILALIAVIVIAALTSLGQVVNNTINQVATTLGGTG